MPHITLLLLLSLVIGSKDKPPPGGFFVFTCRSIRVLVVLLK